MRSSPEPQVSEPEMAVLATVLVTGASGFVGRHLCAHLESQGHEVRRVGRSGDPDWQVADLARHDIPDAAFAGVDTVIHLASSMPGDAQDPDGHKTAQMAQRVVHAACAQGVQRIILLSSVAARLAEDSPAQARAYGVQKREAEIAALSALSPQTHCVILRPPVIYGAGARGSFGLLAGLVRRAPALPLRRADAPRCYLSVGNLCALITHLLHASDGQWRAHSGTPFEPHDGAGVSTRALVQMLAQVSDRKLRLFAVPKPLMRLLGRISGKSDQVEAIFAPLLCEDPQVLQAAFGWSAHEQMPQSLGFLRADSRLYQI